MVKRDREIGRVRPAAPRLSGLYTVAEQISDGTEAQWDSWTLGTQTKEGTLVVSVLFLSPVQSSGSLVGSNILHR